MYYLFSPLLDDKGERVVRRVLPGEYYYHDEDLEVYKWPEDMDEKYQEHPIFTLQKFEDDPLKHLRLVIQVYERWFNDKGFAKSVLEERLWEAIIKTVERVK